MLGAKHVRIHWRSGRRRGMHPAGDVSACGEKNWGEETHKVGDLEEGALCFGDTEDCLEVRVEDIEKLWRVVRSV